MTHPALDISERAFQSLVEQAARATGWYAFHPYDSRRSEPGYPDLTLVNPGKGRVVWAELKTSKGRLSPAQKDWIWALEQAGQEVYVLRPADWPLIERILTGARP